MVSVKIDVFGEDVLLSLHVQKYFVKIYPAALFFIYIFLLVDDGKRKT
jgi:hypothetical protein